MSTQFGGLRTKYYYAIDGFNMTYWIINNSGATEGFYNNSPILDTTKSRVEITAGTVIKEVYRPMVSGYYRVFFSGKTQASATGDSVTVTISKRPASSANYGTNTLTGFTLLAFNQITEGTLIAATDSSITVSNIFWLDAGDEIGLYGKQVAGAAAQTYLYYPIFTIEELELTTIRR